MLFDEYNNIRTNENIAIEKWYKFKYKKHTYKIYIVYFASKYAYNENDQQKLQQRKKRCYWDWLDLIR